MASPAAVTKRIDTQHVSERGISLQRHASFYTGHVHVVSVNRIVMLGLLDGLAAVQGKRLEGTVRFLKAENIILNCSCLLAFTKATGIEL